MPVTTLSPKSPIAFARSGTVDYEKAWQIQRTVHAEVAAGLRPNTLMLLEHPPVFTAGRRTLDHERPSDGTPVIDVDRGGKITWHGPGQIVGYPIVRLANRLDVVGFVREIETALIAVCNEFDIDAERFSERSGVWLRDSNGDRKVAAIGIRYAKGVTMHGFALNVNPDLSWFDRIVPCGLPDATATSMSSELGRNITVEEVILVVERHIYEALARVSA